VGNTAAENLAVKHAGQDEIVDVFDASGDFRFSLAARNGESDRCAWHSVGCHCFSII
jgi:hypothetical protein